MDLPLTLPTPTSHVFVLYTNRQARVTNVGRRLFLVWNLDFRDTLRLYYSTKEYKVSERFSVLSR